MYICVYVLHDPQVRSFRSLFLLLPHKLLFEILLSEVDFISDTIVEIVESVFTACLQNTANDDG